MRMNVNVKCVLLATYCSVVYNINIIRIMSAKNSKKNMSAKTNDSVKSEKKSFDKAQWRKNKYSHKNKLQQFEEKRRKSALHKYYKELKKTQVAAGTEKHSDTQGSGHSSRQRENPYEQAKQELEKRKNEKEQLREEREKQKAERDEALQKYKKDKIRKYVKLKQKTKKGQPVMAGRMELLLEKIQKVVGS